MERIRQGFFFLNPRLWLHNALWLQKIYVVEDAEVYLARSV